MILRKIRAYLYIAMGLFLIGVIGGKLLLQILCIIIGCGFLYRGFVMLSVMKFASRVSTQFFQDTDFKH